MLLHHDPRVRSRLSTLAVCAALALTGTSAYAETGSASAQDVSVNIDLLGVAQLNVDPQASVQFDSAVDATYMQDSLPSLDFGGSLLHLSTGTTSSQAEFAPGVSISSAGGESIIENLDLSALSVIGDSLLSISADEIKSRSPVSGYCLPAGRVQTRGMFGDDMYFNGFDVGNLVPGGVGGIDGTPDPNDVKLTGLGITILGIPIPALPTNPAPNTSVDLGALGITGATLILNEQTVQGDGVNTSTLSSNALHLTMDMTGLITADVVIGHSMGNLACTQ